MHGFFTKHELETLSESQLECARDTLQNVLVKQPLNHKNSIQFNQNPFLIIQDQYNSQLFQTLQSIYPSHLIQSFSYFQSHRNSILNHSNLFTFILHQNTSTTLASTLINTMNTLLSTSPHPISLQILLIPDTNSILTKLFTQFIHISSKNLETFTINAFNLGFTCIDGCVYSLCNPYLLHQVAFHANFQGVTHVAESIKRFCRVANFNLIQIHSAGFASSQVAKYLQKYAIKSDAQYRNESMCACVRDLFAETTCYSCCNGRDFAKTSEDGNMFQGKSEGENVTVICIDRAVDLVSLMMTQSSYEGLLDEHFGFCGDRLVVEVEKELKDEEARETAKNALESAPKSKRQNGSVMCVNVSDKLFAELRDLDYGKAMKMIGSAASGVREYYATRPRRETESSAAKSAAEKGSDLKKLRHFVQNLSSVTEEHYEASMHMALGLELAARTLSNRSFRVRFEAERMVLSGSAALSVGGTGISGSGDHFVQLILDEIAVQSLPVRVLRLIVLWSASSGGISLSRHERLLGELAAAYGASFAARVLFVLQTCGFIRWTQTPSLFAPAELNVNLLTASLNSLLNGSAAARTEEEAKYRLKKSQNAHWVNPFGDEKVSSESEEASRLPLPMLSLGVIAALGETTKSEQELYYSWQYVRARLRLFVDPLDPEEGTAESQLEKGKEKETERLKHQKNPQEVKRNSHGHTNSGRDGNAIEKESLARITASLERSMAGCFAGYVPLSVRLVECAINGNGWSSLMSTSRFSRILPIGHSLTSVEIQNEEKKEKESMERNESGHKYIVVMVGGITRSELSALRWLSRKLQAKERSVESTGSSLLVLTTSIVSGDSILHEMLLDDDTTMR
uniref:Uncharacterized protein n=1 Tax=Timspurckia oligopyrenoides TaxID=708627 RepID=A0A7S0ZAG9_9RHOD|mmetsp:Transcript_10194/g.18356  ORF Transcript_10194/g.18356 Transcript_10194/m.18356 type:complete len:855 (+) Transcript_10194:19-2583(+)